jgi:hypothetical protein
VPDFGGLIALFWLYPVPYFGVNPIVLFTHGVKFASYVALFWLYPVPYFGVNPIVLFAHGVKFASYIGLAITASDYIYTNYLFMFY